MTEFHAEVFRCDRWTWAIAIFAEDRKLTPASVTYGTRAMAYRKARRLLRRFRRYLVRMADQVTIT